jgi:hypothetical protein
MPQFFKGLVPYIESIYTAWLMILISLQNILMPNPTTFEIALAIFTLILFVPKVVQYHVLKTRDEFGNPLNVDSK